MAVESFENFEYAHLLPKPPKRRSSILFEKLQQEIVLGALRPKQTLTELELARRFDCSQGTVREALMQLNEVGLVERQPNNGTFVSPCEPTDAQALLHIRSEIECRFLDRVIKNADASLDRDLQDLLNAMRNAARDSDEYVLSVCDRAFHLRLFQVANLPLVSPMLARCLIHNHRFKILNSTSSRDLEATAERHMPIIRAVSERDAEHLTDLLSHHIGTIVDIGPIISNSPTLIMGRLSPNMSAVIERLAKEDVGVGDPTLMAPKQARAVCELTNMRWNSDLPVMADAQTLVHAGLPARWVVPKNDRGTDAILYVHGGGWSLCSPATHEGAARHLANACACPVLTVDYRLAPEDQFPAGLEDILAAWRARPSDRRWSIAGDSSGANLSLAAMLALIKKNEVLPASGLLFYGVYGADFSTDSYTRNANAPGLTREKMMRYWDWYAPIKARDNPLVAPLAATDEMLHCLPPLYLNAAELDPLLFDTEALSQRLCALGRQDVFDHVHGVVHGFMQMTSVLPEAREAFRRAGEVFSKITV